MYRRLFEWACGRLVQELDVNCLEFSSFLNQGQVSTQERVKLIQSTIISL